MDHREKNTIEAINKLGANYPYAAAMLVYVIIERQLKEYLLANRNGQFGSREIRINNGDTVKLVSYANKSDDDFLKNVICKATLGAVEKTLGITQKRPSSYRNELFHSNLYMLSEKNLLGTKRHAKNIKRFKIAKVHLKRIFREFSDYTISDKNGEIILRPNESIRRGR